MMTLARFICGLFAVVAIVIFIGLLTVDQRKVITRHGRRQNKPRLKLG